MKKLVILALLALAFCGQPAYAQQQDAPKCYPFLETMEQIDKVAHVERLINLPEEKRLALRAALGLDEAFDLILVVDHGNGKYGIVVGHREPADICFGTVVPEQALPAFLEITGLPGGERGSI